MSSASCNMIDSLEFLQAFCHLLFLDHTLIILCRMPSECQTVWVKIRPDLAQNCLQKLTSDDTGRKSNCTLHDTFFVSLKRTDQNTCIIAAPARSHTFVEIDHEIISTSFSSLSLNHSRRGFFQLQAKVCARSTG